MEKLKPKSGKGGLDSLICFAPVSSNSSNSTITIYY